MIFLSAFLLCLLVNLTPLTLSLLYADKRMYFSKSIILLFSIITSIGMVVFMYAGNLIVKLFVPLTGNIFGALCLSLIGVYYIVEYIKIANEAAGYDTSYYYESSFEYKNFLNSFSRVDELNKTNIITISNCVKFSIEFLINNTLIYISSGITGVNIALCVFINFIISLLVLHAGHLYSKDNIIYFFSRHFYLIGGILLITLGIFEAFL